MAALDILLSAVFAGTGWWFVRGSVGRGAGPAGSVTAHAVLCLAMLAMVWRVPVPGGSLAAACVAAAGWFAAVAVRHGGDRRRTLGHCQHLAMAAVAAWMAVRHAGPPAVGGWLAAALTVAGFAWLAGALAAVGAARPAGGAGVVRAGYGRGSVRQADTAGHAAGCLAMAVMLVAMPY